VVSNRKGQFKTKVNFCTQQGIRLLPSLFGESQISYHRPVDFFYGADFENMVHSNWPARNNVLWNC